MPEAPVSEEVRQLMDLLRMLARTLGLSNAALARKADVSLASLVRYFKGEAEPRLDFVLLVVRAIGLSAREFFELAYPAGEAPTAARQKIERVLGPVRPGRVLESPPPKEPEPRPEATPLRRENIDSMLEDLRRDVREILERQAGKAEPPEAAERPPRTKNGKK
ncbi:MAG: helix-turn-helix domain-containing protein [Thermoanaerobaculia bacterium]